MLDMKKVGIKICAFRKKAGYSQEKLAEMLHISPQAVSRWENGHTLPDTQTLPMLAQIFGCTIDEIIMPAYAFDEKIETEKPDSLERQAEHIAQIVIKQIGDNMMQNKIGLDDDEIITAVKNFYPDAFNFTMIRSTPEKAGRDSVRHYKIIYIAVRFMRIFKHADQITETVECKELKLVEKIFAHEINETNQYVLFNRFPTQSAPKTYFANTDRRILLTEDLSDGYFKGDCFNDENENGKIYRENLNSLIRSTADFHSALRLRSELGEISTDWRFQSKENLLAHISGMEKDYRKYRKDEESGKIPKTWEPPGYGKIFTNVIDSKQLDYFEQALEYLKTEYPKLIDSRFNAIKNIMRIHGDLHPGNTFMSKSADRTVKFIDFQGMRAGLCTEDLAMLLALHIEPDRKKSEPLLKYYHECLCEKVTDYSYETFINDYKISVAENMFFPIRLINQGIFAFNMRDSAIKAFETFVLEK